MGQMVHLIDDLMDVSRITYRSQLRSGWVHQRWPPLVQQAGKPSRFASKPVTNCRSCCRQAHPPECRRCGWAGAAT
jgi:hypothetical protein